MAKGSSQVQNLGKTTENGQQTAVPMRHLSLESAEALRGLAAQSPEKLRKILERLAALAGERANATGRDK